MLKQAILYEEQLKRKYMEAMCDDYFKFFTGCSYHSFTIDIVKSDWSEIQRVSVNRDGLVIGFITCQIERDSNNASRFGIMNFTKKSNIIFANDVLEFLRELKDGYNINRMEFMAYIGSEAEKMYTEFIKKHGGSVVGVEKRVAKLPDGKYYDCKIFEILREDMKF